MAARRPFGGAGNNYRRGDWDVIDDRTGFKVKASETVREWTGLRVHWTQVDPRHPQDFVRGVPDRQKVPFTRPESAAVYIGVAAILIDDFSWFATEDSSYLIWE